MPAFAATAVDRAMTSGIANPRACGQAMTETVTVRTTASVDAAGEQPGNERHRTSGGGDVEENGGEAVGQRLGPAAARLGVGDEPLNPGQGGVVTDRVDTHADRRVGGHRPGDDAVAFSLRRPVATRR